MSLIKKLGQGLSKTKEILTTDIDELFSKSDFNENLLEELEELLISADLGVQITMKLIQHLEQNKPKLKSAAALKQILKTEILNLIPSPNPDTADSFKPRVIMVVGVNGVGKTTTIGKLASRFTKQGHKVLIAAADTFRAAAIEQLTIWSQRAGAEIVTHRENSDPAAVVFDALTAAQARSTDIVLVDTAGRLHTKVNLMEELKKIQRSVTKKISHGHEILLVLDATTGQNAISQTRLFNETLGKITGICLTKLDGTARGGIVVNICSSFKIPLQYIGVGEDVQDLQEFKAREFVDALL